MPAPNFTDAERTKEELRIQILGQMCDCAENISQYYLAGSPLTNMHFIEGMVPEAFKPGVSDKFLFNRIIDKIIDNFYQEISKGIIESSLAGVNAMARYYYPDFGVWKKMPRRKTLYKRLIRQ